MHLTRNAHLHPHHVSPNQALTKSTRAQIPPKLSNSSQTEFGLPNPAHWRMVSTLPWSPATDSAKPLKLNLDLEWLVVKPAGVGVFHFQAG